MGYRANPIGLLIQLNPDEARRQLIELVNQLGGSTTRIAAAKGVDNATVKRWFLRLADKGYSLDKQIADRRKADAASARENADERRATRRQVRGGLAKAEPKQPVTREDFDIPIVRRRRSAA